MCKTRYPIFLIHGTGFRDRKHFGYWGRIPKVLEPHTAHIGYGHQDSWGTIEHNAGVVRKNLLKFIEETGCGKVNIIAHSKGGIEARYLASALECAPHIASITTISTPHHGSKTMDIVHRLPVWLLRAISVLVNLWCRLLGDEKPDFLGTCRQFTTEYMRRFNADYPDVDGIYYQSYTTVMQNPFSDFIMLFPNFIVNLVEGANDGLVTVTSARWTNFNGVWKGATSRGISHPDVVDLRRRRLSKKASDTGVTDICDCYVGIVERLKADGF